MMGARRQMADLGGMMNKFASADPEVAAMQKAQKKKAAKLGPSRDERRVKRKAQRKARRNTRRR